MKKAYFAGGCFWGMEFYFKKLDGVIETNVGFMGGDEENPTYEEVSSKKTGHAETIEVVYDESKSSYEDLAKLFFEIHDPTQKDKQGPDVGKQYRSAAFYADDIEKDTIDKLIAILKTKDINAVTIVEPVSRFYKAGEEHQQYYEKQGGTPYCHIKRKIF